MTHPLLQPNSRVTGQKIRVFSSWGIMIPLERHAKVVELYQKASQVAEDLGLTLPERFSGGASDGNFTAAMGRPTLCGIGAVGDGAHAVHEFIAVNWIARRMGIIVGLLSTLD